jgi:hypothetical protein
MGKKSDPTASASTSPRSGVPLLLPTGIKASISLENFRELPCLTFVVMVQLVPVWMNGIATGSRKHHNHIGHKI